MDANHALDKAIAAQEAVIKAEEALTQAVRDRAQAIKVAFEAGTGASRLADSFGVSRQRIYGMAKQGS